MDSIKLTTTTDKALAKQMSATNQPQQWERALKQWVVAGGALKVQRSLAFKTGSNNNDLLEECTQDAIVKAWQRVCAGAFAYRGCTFSTYVTSIALNVYRKERNRCRRELVFVYAGDEEIAAKAASDELDQLEAEITNSQLFQHLSQKERQILTERYLEEKSYKEIAAAQTYSPNGDAEAAARQAVSRALKVLRRFAKHEALRS